MICPNCNNEISDDCVFCKKCGVRIAEPESAGNASEVKKENPVPYNKKFAGKAAIGTVAVIIVAIGIYFGYNYMKLSRSVAQFKEYVLAEDFDSANTLVKSKEGNEAFQKKAVKAGEAIFNDYISNSQIENAARLYNSGFLNEDEPFLEGFENQACQEIADK